MTSREEHIDEFESVFRRSTREPFVYADVPIESVALVTDGSVDEAEQARESLLKFLPTLPAADSWRLITGSDYSNVGQLLKRIDSKQTDLVLTYRHLQEKSLVPQHSLGVFLDVLTQVMSIPVLVLPGTAARPTSLAERVCNRVMVVTDHISGDNRLINYGARMCAAGGTVWLCHVEDEAVFSRYMRAIERIPEIESDRARDLIAAQLNKEASDFVETCISVLQEKGPHVSFQSSVTRGHHLREYRQLIDNNDVDLIIVNTSDEDQLAMHGMTYSLSVEMIDVAMLLL
jgi:nucleotide-binding universal stress UspA family protein